MLCTFCGTDNSPENKFCGMCGVKLERRKVERRVRHGAASLKCASCGHVCEPGSTFCGMCGARIERRLSTRRAAEERATAIANVQLPSPDLAEEQNAADARVSSPSAVKDIPAEAAAPNGSPEPELPPAAPLPEVTPRPPAAIFRSDSPAQRPTPAQRSTIGGPSFLGLNDPPDNAGGDYLLEDEKPSRSYGRAFVFLAILAVVLGFVVVQWRPSLLASLKRFVPSKAAPAPSPQVEQPKPEASPTPEAANTSAVAEPSPTPAPASASDKTVPDQPDSSKPSVAATPAPVEERSKANSEDASARARKDAAKKERDKAREEAQSLKPSPTLLKAQDYLQGRNGVRQDCDQAMTYLRAAVQRGEPAAAMQMGELYAGGRCVQQDRVTAYRWMNSAREKAPGNATIQATVDQLWGRMTPQERKDAGH